MNIVANSTPLIELSKIHRLTIPDSRDFASLNLRDVYGKIIIPEEVHSVF